MKPPMVAMRADDKFVVGRAGEKRPCLKCGVALHVSLAGIEVVEKLHDADGFICEKCSGMNSLQDAIEQGKLHPVIEKAMHPVFGLIYKLAKLKHEEAKRRSNIVNN